MRKYYFRTEEWYPVYDLTETKQHFGEERDFVMLTPEFYNHYNKLMGEFRELLDQVQEEDYGK